MVFRITNLIGILQEVENKKRQLEEAVDSLNEECAKLKAAEQMQAVSTIDKAAEQEQALLIKGALEQQLDQHREAHQKQVSLALYCGFVIYNQTSISSFDKVAMLRDEITDKQTVIEDLRDSKRELTLIHEQLVRDYDRLKQEESDKSHKLQELLGANERREQARQDLKVQFSDLFSPLRKYF